MSRFRLTTVSKTTCPEPRSNSPIWARCILRFCRLPFADCMILGRRSRSGGMDSLVSRKKVNSSLFPQFKGNPISSSASKLPKIGAVPINLLSPIPDGFKVKQVRVLSRVRGTQWYVVVSIESDVSVPDMPAHGRAIGIDLGLERFLTVSDGSFQERPKFFKALQGKLKLLQRRAERKQKGSQNWEKAQLKVSKLHHRIANRRKNFHLKTAHKLCDQAQTIFAEDLNAKGLARGMLRKDCLDVSFGQFLSLLGWVCWKRGVYFAKVDPNGTSQTCPSCLATVRKELAVREHHCPECGYRTHRDHASAEMILLRGLENVVAQGHWGKETTCQVGLSGVWRGAGIPNREVGRA
jgi:putative transposase